MSTASVASVRLLLDTHILLPDCLPAAYDPGSEESVMVVVVVGLVILVAAVIVAVAGVLSNSGASHGLAHGWAAPA